MPNNLKISQSFDTKYLIFIPFVFLILLTFRIIPFPERKDIQASVPSLAPSQTSESSSPAPVQEEELGPVVKEYYPDGKILSIEGRANGKKDGSFRKFLPNGQIVLFASYKDGVLDGEYREYHENGEWKIIRNYKEGQLEGLTKEFDESGQLIQQVYYHKDKPISNGQESEEN